MEAGFGGSRLGRNCSRFSGLDVIFYRVGLVVYGSIRMVGKQAKAYMYLPATEYLNNHCVGVLVLYCTCIYSVAPDLWSGVRDDELSTLGGEEYHGDCA